MTEACDLSQLKTPCYVYALERLESNARAYTEALAGANALVCYAVKANGAPEILSRLASLGLGADAVSAGEVRSALAAGFPPQRIIFSGVGKTTDEIRHALTVHTILIYIPQGARTCCVEAGIGQVNAESAEELDEVEALVGAEFPGGVGTRVALRVNTDTDARTHDFLATSRSCDKFGVPPRLALDLCRQWRKRFPHLHFAGLTIHLGSSISSLAVFEEGFGKLGALAEAVARETGLGLGTLDFGGGVGIDSEGDGRNLLDVAELCRLIVPTRDRAAPQAQILVEPGRSIVGSAGVLLSRVVRVKAEGVAGRPLAVLDAGMNDFLRPALYGARHRLTLVQQGDGDAPV